MEPYAPYLYWSSQMRQYLRQQAKDKGSLNKRKDDLTVSCLAHAWKNQEPFDMLPYGECGYT